MMSDDDFMCDDDDDYNLEYSEDSNSEPDNDFENQYYNAKAAKEVNVQNSIQDFEQVVELERIENEKGEWGFKALKQIIKIHYKSKNYEEMIKNYKLLLTYIKSAVTRNYSEKSINGILDYISTSEKESLLEEFYEITLVALMSTKNDRLWFKTNTKLGKLYFDRKEFQKLQNIITELRKSCQNELGEDDLKKGTQLLEIYALEIQMYTEQKNDKKLKNIYVQSLMIKSAIPHPLIMGVIRECGGKMHLREGKFEKALTDFFEAFKNFDESGCKRRINCLKYLVLASMLMKSVINPFDSQEAKPYKSDPEIAAMTSLVNAYQNRDISNFLNIIKKSKATLLKDAFISEHLQGLMHNIRMEVIIKIIKPFKSIKIKYIAKELGVEMDEATDLLVTCILDKSIDAWIDQQTDIMYIKQEPENQEHQQLLSNLSDVITSSFDKYPNVPSACE